MALLEFMSKYAAALITKSMELKKQKCNMVNTKQQMGPDKKKELNSIWAAAAAAVEREFLVSETESLMREKALTKPVEIGSNKQTPPYGPKFINSATDSLRTTHSLKRNFQNLDNDCVRKKQRSSHGPKLMHSAIDSPINTNILKRSWQSINNDDTDWGPEECKKQKVVEKNSVKRSTAGSIKITPKKNEAISPSSSSHHQLPEKFKSKIENLKGTQVALVIEKELTKTDLTQSGNRMSMPLNQIASTNFLTSDEKKGLDNRQETMTVQLIDPGLVQGEINLRQWNMKKGEGREGSKMYVLRTQWGDVSRRNKLKQGDLVQVWAFRVYEEEGSDKKEGQLYLALVLVKRSGGGGGDHDQKESDHHDGGCKSSVVGADQSSGGDQGGGVKAVIEEGAGGNNGNTSGGSTVTINGSDHASPSHSASSSKKPADMEATKKEDD